MKLRKAAPWIVRMMALEDRAVFCLLLCSLRACHLAQRACASEGYHSLHHCEVIIGWLERTAVKADAGGRVACLKICRGSISGTAFRAPSISKNIINVLQHDPYLKLTTVNKLLKVNFRFLQNLRWQH